MEASRAAARSSCDEVKRRVQEEIDLLVGRTQRARQAQWSFGDEGENQENDVKRLQLALQDESAKARQLAGDRQRCEELVRDLMRQLQEVRENAFDSSAVEMSL